MFIEINEAAMTIPQADRPSKAEPRPGGTASQHWRRNPAPSLARQIAAAKAERHRAAARTDPQSEFDLMDNVPV